MTAFLDALWKRELDLGIMELLDSWTTAVGNLDSSDLDDLDTISLGTMTSSHVTVGLSNGTSSRDITVFTVHVVLSITGSITEPDTIILNRSSLLLVDFFAGDDLTVSLLHTTKHTGEVPETRLGDDVVAGEDFHLVQLGVGIPFCGQLAADHNELL